VMVGESIASLITEGLLPEQDGSVVPMDAPIAVKEAVLPFKRFRTKEGKIVDSLLGPEMRSTGEVMGMDVNFPIAFAKSQAGAYGGLPQSGTVFISVADRDKRTIVLPALRFHQLGFTIVATEGTAEILQRNGIPTTIIGKVSSQSGEDTIVELINRNEVDIVINTPSGSAARADGYEIRASAIAADKPLFTNMAQVGAAVASIDTIREGFNVTSLQEYAIARREALARL
jgi:carbamoyl-phosphate synthase large subunit